MKKIIKISAIFIFILVASLRVMATGYAQTVSLDLKIDRAQLRDVFREIERRTELSFLFSDDNSALKTEVSVNMRNKNIRDILNELFKGTDLSYQILNEKLIVIAPKVVFNRSVVITGAVTDERGEILPGVSVMVKGTTIGVVTGYDGRYAISVPDGDVVLVFSFIGYFTREIAVGDMTDIPVTLYENVSQLDEVVVVGYGAQKKVNMTGAVATVSGQDISSKATTDVLSAIQGQLPGVAITRLSGQPGRETEGTGEWPFQQSIRVFL